MTITLVLPMPPNLANARMHWRTKHRAKVDYWATLDMWQAHKLIPPPPSQPFAKASLRSAMLLGAAMDDDNAMHRHKFALDWLKTRGYIVDDKKKCLTWEGFPSQTVKRGQPYTLTLTLTPL